MFDTKEKKSRPGRQGRLLSPIPGRREDRIALLLDVGALLLGLLFSCTHIAFGAYPLGIALIAVLPSRVWYAVLGAALGGLTLGKSGLIYGMIYIILAFLRLIISSGSDTPREVDQGKAGGDAHAKADRSDRITGAIRGEGSFREGLMLRISVAVIGGFIAGVYELLLSGFNQQTLLFALCMLLVPPAVTLLLFGLFGGEVDLKTFLSRREEGGERGSRVILFKASALVLCFLLSLSLAPYSFLGISVAYLFSGAVCLIGAHLFGSIAGGALGFASALGLSGTYATAFALAGLLSGSLFNLGAVAGIVSGGTALCLFSAYVGGLEGFLTVLPEYVISSALALPIIKKLPKGERAEKPKEKDKEPEPKRLARDMVGTVSLSYSNKYKGSLSAIEGSLCGLGESLKKYSEAASKPTLADYRDLIQDCILNFSESTLPALKQAGMDASLRYSGNASSQRNVGEGSGLQQDNKALSLQNGGNASRLQPGGNGSVLQPSGNGSALQPGGNGSVLQPSGNGSVLQPGSNGSTFQPAVGGSMLQHGGNVLSTQNAGNGSSPNLIGNNSPLSPGTDRAPKHPIQESALVYQSPDPSLKHPSAEASLRQASHEYSFKQPDSQSGYNYESNKGLRESEPKGNVNVCLHFNKPSMPSEEELLRLAERLMTRGRVEKEDFSTMPELYAIGDSLAAAIMRGVAILRQSCHGAKQTDTVGEDLTMISRLISEGRLRDESERCVNEEKTKALSELMEENGIDGAVCIVLGERQCHIIAAAPDPDGTALSGAELIKQIEKRLDMRITLPDYTRRDNVTLLEATSLPRLRCTAAYAGVCAKGETVSGDTVSSFKTSDERFHLVLSDGMGTGRDARTGSELVTDFMRSALDVGTSAGAELTLGTLNRIIKRQRKEQSMTLDLFTADLITGDGSFLKSGAASSYVKRGDSIFRIRSRTAPLGLLSTLDAEKIRAEIHPGSYVIMLSDGITVATEDSGWFLQLLAEEPLPDLDAYAKHLLDTCLSHLPRTDDCTVAVVRIDNAQASA